MDIRSRLPKYPKKRQGAVFNFTWTLGVWAFPFYFFVIPPPLKLIDANFRIII